MSTDSARPLDTMAIDVDGLGMRRLRDRAVIREAAPGHFYLDAVLRVVRARRWKNAGVIVRSRVSTRPFLTAEWRQLLMLNWRVDPALLAPHVPSGTTLDTFAGAHWVSLVGFLFVDTRVLGIPIPFHRDFEEINLRFYVRRSVDSESRGASAGLPESGRGQAFGSILARPPDTALLADGSTIAVHLPTRI